MARAKRSRSTKDGLAAFERFHEARDGTGQALAESAREAVVDAATGKVGEVIKGIDDKLNRSVEIHDHPPPAVPTD